MNAQTNKTPNQIDGDGKMVIYSKQLKRDSGTLDVRGRPAASTEDLARLEWWSKARFGMFIHWGLYAVPAGTWGEGTLKKTQAPKRALVIGGGPAGLEYARVAAARGHTVTLMEEKSELGGHVRLQSLLPSRSEFGEIARWLADQAAKNGAELRTVEQEPAAAWGLDALGHALLNAYNLVFETLSVVLLLAIIGAILISRKERDPQ